MRTRRKFFQYLIRLFWPLFPLMLFVVLPFSYAGISEEVSGFIFATVMIIHVVTEGIKIFREAK